jgi:hypothetical protein
LAVAFRIGAGFFFGAAFAARFFDVEAEGLADFAAVLRLGAAFDFFGADVAGVRFLAVEVFVLVGRLPGWLLARFLRAAMTAPVTAPITVPTTGVPTAVPTTAPATAPPRVLFAAPASSTGRSSFLSSSVMLLSSVMSVANQTDITATYVFQHANYCVRTDTAIRAPA